MPFRVFSNRGGRAFRTFLLAAVFLAVFSLSAGCAYKSEIRQGNDMLPEKIGALRAGMNKEEVRELLGENRNPAFFTKGDSWFYYFRRRESGFFPEVETWRVELVFDGETLSEINSSPPLEELQTPEAAEAVE